MITRIFPFHPTPALLAVLAGLSASLSGADPVVSYNGIEWKGTWPPKGTIGREPLKVAPYLASPPAVIPIDLGRQLFVDDFLIAETTMVRTSHRPVYHTGNPVMKPDRSWDIEHAAMFSDGVWFDSKDGLFKIWYWGSGKNAGERISGTCLATSRDGITWSKPDLGVVAGTNVVLRDEPGTHRNSGTVWLDHAEPDTAKRFKMFRVLLQPVTIGGRRATTTFMRASYSSNGINWIHAADSDPIDDRTTVFYNPFRKVWVASLRHRDGDGRTSGRYRLYYEDARWTSVLRWTGDRGRVGTVPWVGADRLDHDRGDLVLNRDPKRPFDTVPSQLYNLDCVAYESVMLGLFSIWRGSPVGRAKINEVCVGYSRDGFHWSRPDRQAFCPVSEDRAAWNYGNVQSAGGACLVVGDKLYFYVGGAGAEMAVKYPDHPNNVGLAILRRDGFASMDADARGGTLTTRPLTFSGQYLFVNVNAPAGSLSAEIMDEQGSVVPGFEASKCVSITADSTCRIVQWKGEKKLADLAKQPIRLRFHLRNGELYSFWIASSSAGASQGFVAAGGPGISGDRDTQGFLHVAARPD